MHTLNHKILKGSSFRQTWKFPPLKSTRFHISLGSLFETPKKYLGTSNWLHFPNLNPSIFRETKSLPLKKRNTSNLRGGKLNFRHVGLFFLRKAAMKKQMGFSETSLTPPAANLQPKFCRRKKHTKAVCDQVCFFGGVGRWGF